MAVYSRALFVVNCRCPVKLSPVGRLFFMAVLVTAIQSSIQRAHRGKGIGCPQQVRA
jgi:hypothetical protein